MNDENNDNITLTILQKIHENSGITQRKLASDHKVALGSINIILKRLMNKGFVKITEVHPKRFLYFLTPKGFNEKTRLLLSYINRSILIYKDIKNHVEGTLEEMIKDHCRSVVLCGLDDGFDIVYLAIQEKGLKIAELYDFNEENIGERKFGYTIKDAQLLKNISDDNAILIASVASEPLIRMRLEKVLKTHKKVYGIV